MRTLCLLLVIFLLGCDSSGIEPEPAPVRGDVIDVTTLVTYTAEEVSQLVGAYGIPYSARYGVSFYVMEYLTVDTHGEETTASGAVAVPQPFLRSLPMVSYQHGTITRRSSAPSRGDTNEAVVGMFFAADGYLSVMPDLIGLGRSPGLHPYLIADVSASAIVDMMQAVVRWSATQPWSYSGEVYMAGYSAGGYTGMAAHRLLEAEYSSEFTIKASSLMAGPYDLSGTMLDLMLREEPYPQPYYFPYVLFSYNEAYGLYNSPSDFLASPYDVTLPPLFDGMHGGGDINEAMPTIPIQIVHPNVLRSFRSDLNHPFRQRLRENDLTNWTPRVPTRLYHCAADELVPIENSSIAAQALGEAATLLDPSPQSGHGDCAPLAIASTRAWFNSVSTSGQ